MCGGLKLFISMNLNIENSIYLLSSSVLLSSEPKINSRSLLANQFTKMTKSS